VSDSCYVLKVCLGRICMQIASFPLPSRTWCSNSAGFLALFVRRREQDMYPAVAVTDHGPHSCVIKPNINHTLLSHIPMYIEAYRVFVNDH
jgi:hypothetical protein